MTRERGEPRVPFGADSLEPGGGLVERRGVERVSRLAAAALAPHEARRVESREVLRDRQSRHGNLSCELGLAGALASGEYLEHEAPGRVCERVEDAIYAAAAHDASALSSSAIPH